VLGGRVGWFEKGLGRGRHERIGLDLNGIGLGRKSVALKGRGWINEEGKWSGESWTGNDGNLGYIGRYIIVLQ